ncbi:HlyD family secretion protein [Thiohalocapsa sp. ML1]|uniref:HlyD family secretion protein n=1 Tax=Thiohalocapsa sp. ML1 TaxID=1431688 RepID=UPI000732320B|nr:HlyD family efflux transporter periplasmic adaptor subunit [Thiohalocapsa sp. ML1]
MPQPGIPAHPGLTPAAVLLTAALAGCEPAPEAGLALGTLERDRVALTATVAEVLVELPVARGTAVTKGTVLARLDDRQQRAQVERARAEVAQATAELEKRKHGPRPQEIAAARALVAGAEAALREAEITYERNRSLETSKSVSEADVDKSKALRDAARARLEQEQQNLDELLAGTRAEDIQAAEAALAAAEAELAYQQALLADLTIEATRDGVLDNLPWNLGERVTVGSPVVVMLAGKVPYARVYVPEPYRVRINEGDRLSVRVDGLAQTFDGRVRWISAEPSFTPYYALNESDRSRLVYVAEVELPDTAADLPNGVPAQVVMP